MLNSKMPLFSLFCAALFCVSFGCNGGGGNPQYGTGQIGESCRSNSDCLNGLACVSNVCSPLGDNDSLDSEPEGSDSCIDGDCGEVEGGAWTDLSTGLVWQNPPASTTMKYDEARNYCANLRTAGFEDWRVPTIIELRSLVTGCSEARRCNVGSECVEMDCRSESCDGCWYNDFGGPAEGCYWPTDLDGNCFNEYWSSTESGDGSGLWTIYYGCGWVSLLNKAMSGLNVRCVRNNCEFGQFNCENGDCINSDLLCNDESDCADGSDEPDELCCITTDECTSTQCDENDAWCYDNCGRRDHKKMECGMYGCAEGECELGPEVWKDETSSLEWENPGSETELYMYDEEGDDGYCNSLVKAGHDDWRIPTVSELRSLVRGCPQSESSGACNFASAGCGTSSCWDGACSGCEDHSESDDCYWPDEIQGVCGFYVATMESWYDRIGGDNGVIDFGSALMGLSGGEYPGHMRCVRGSFVDNKCVSIRCYNGDLWCYDYDEYRIDRHSACGEMGCLDGQCDPEPGVWEDTGTGLMWQTPFSSSGKTWYGAVGYCQNLDLAGFGDWRLPTISELRSLIKGCAATEVGGGCLVTDECLFDCLSVDECAGCNPDSREGISCYANASPIGGCDQVWSSSNEIPEDMNDTISWYVDFKYGSIYATQYLGFTKNAACVRGRKIDSSCISRKCFQDDVWCYNASGERDHLAQECGTNNCLDGGCSIPGEAWEDQNEKLAWQNPYRDKQLNWYDAQAYCDALVLSGKSDWRLPTISELRSLVRGCSELEIGGSCNIDENGCASANCEEGCYSISCDTIDDEGCFWPDQFTGECEARYFWSSTIDEYAPFAAWITRYDSARLYEQMVFKKSNAICVSDI